jgi:hypothetical protein
MHAGAMDPTRKEETRLARGYAVDGVLLCSGSWAAWGSVLLMGMASFSLGCCWPPLPEQIRRQ